jgi:hypothetical protein
MMPLLDTEQLEIAACARPAPNKPLIDKQMKKAQAANAAGRRRGAQLGAASSAQGLMMADA